MSHRDELLANMARAWTDLDAAVAAIRDTFDRPDDGGWRPQDGVAHIATWERMAVRKIAGTPLPEGEEIAAKTPWNLDAFNDAMIERWRHRSAEDVLTELTAAHRDLVAAVEGADDSSCARGGTTWTAIDDDGAGHYVHHFPIPDAMAE